jgi:hypothetical protein
LQENVAPKSSAPLAVAVSILLVVLGAASWIRADVFSEPTKLWEDVLQADKNPQSWLAAYNLSRSRQSDASAALDEAGRLLQGGDPDSSKQSAQDALTHLDESDQLLQRVLENPNTPDDVRYKAYDQLAQNDITRMRSPDSNSAAILPHAAEQLRLAMTFTAASDDPLPYYTLGIVDQLRAQAMQKKAEPTTRTAEALPTTSSATTRPNSPQEQEYLELYLTSRDNFQQAAKRAEAGLNSPILGPEATRVLPLAALESGHIDWTLAAMAREHNDINGETQYSRAAVVDYAQAVRNNPGSVETRYRFALALENLGDLNGAKEQLMVILRDLDHYNAPAYNEIGRVILESRPTDMAEFNAAVESFKTALKLDPNLTGAQRNLQLALRMLATTRPATRSTTGPSSQP